MTLEPTLQKLDQLQTNALFRARRWNISLRALHMATLQRPGFRRTANGLGLFICVLILASAYYLQHYEGLTPCPLCMLQRVVMAALGLVFLSAALHNPRHRGNRWYGVLIVLVAGLGSGIAGYHVWIQSYQEASYCLPPLSYLLASFPLSEVISLLLESPGHCSEIQWTFLGLSIPSWSLTAFVSLGILGTVCNMARQTDAA